MSFPDNIFLTGFSGTGKTLVGREVACLLGWEFFDMDAEIEARAGKPVSRIFAEDGESVFRTMEKSILREVCHGHGKVVATGGGSVVDPENRELMLASGAVICLDALPETIYHRLTADGVGQVESRPLLSGPEPLEGIKYLKASRQANYSTAHRKVDTDGLTVEKVAREVVDAWRALHGGRVGDSMDDPDLAAVVNHSGGSYPILVGRGLLDGLGERLKGLGINGPVYVVSDDRVFPEYGRQAQRSLQRAGIEAHCFIIPAGEQSKSLQLAEAIYQWLAGRRAERGHGVIAVGGGVVGDLAGFVAATFLRGMPFIQVPTSMAAMVDASIGGKVAVNLSQGKNLVGAFYQPQMVLADVSALSTMGRRELAEGWAEAIKHGLILDGELFDIFEEHAEALMDLEEDISTEVIKRSVAIKAQVVSEDERETLGRRILLNYGHTIGHALEAATGYGHYLHGEAVSVGMMGAARISHRMGMIGEDVVLRQQRLFHRFGLPTTASDVEPGQVLTAMALDKKTEGRAIKWVLLEDVGRVVVRRDVPAEVVEETVTTLCGPTV